MEALRHAIREVSTEHISNSLIVSLSAYRQRRAYSYIMLMWTFLELIKKNHNSVALICSLNELFSSFTIGLSPHLVKLCWVVLNVQCVLFFFPLQVSWKDKMLIKHYAYETLCTMPILWTKQFVHATPSRYFFYISNAFLYSSFALTAYAILY